MKLHIDGDVQVIHKGEVILNCEPLTKAEFEKYSNVGTTEEDIEMNDEELKIRRDWF